MFTGGCTVAVAGCGVETPILRAERGVMQSQ